MGVSGGGDHNHSVASNYYYYTDSGSSDASGYIWVQPQQWKDDQYVYNDKQWTVYNDSDWNTDVYIDGVPVGQRIKELQDCIKMLHGILKRKFGCVARDEKLTEMVENLTSEKQEVADAHTHEQPLKDELFEI